MSSSSVSVNSTPTGGSSGGSGNDSIFSNAVFFWVVNCVSLVVLVVALYWYYRNVGSCPVCWAGNYSVERSRMAADQAYREHLQRHREIQQERRRGTPEKRKRLLLHSFKRCKVHMVVREGDLVGRNMIPKETIPENRPAGEAAHSTDVDTLSRGGGNDDDDDGAIAAKIPVTTAALCQHEDVELGSRVLADGVVVDVDLDGDNDSVDAQNGFLRLRTSDSEQQTQKFVPNCCAICLASYEVGEHVVWSSNPLCPHAFHMNCMVDWLTKMRDGTPCPCCRAEFTDLEIMRMEQKITWTPGHAFNVNAITFR